MNLEIKKLTINDGQEIYDFLQKIDAVENDFTNEANGMTYQEFKDWLIKQDDWSQGKNLPQNYVPQSTYWLYLNGAPIGYGKIRHKLTEFSRENGGNIGYAILREHRGKGYGTYLFGELVKIGRTIGVEEFIATVKLDNFSSRAAIEKCGGKLVRQNEHFWYFEL